MRLGDLKFRVCRSLGSAVGGSEGFGGLCGKPPYSKFAGVGFKATQGVMENQVDIIQ